MFAKACFLFFLEDIVRYAVVPVNVGGAVDGEAVVIGKLFAPGLSEAVLGPIVPVVSTPQNGSSGPIQELLGNDTAAVMFNIHEAHGVVGLPADGDGVSARNVQKKR